MVPSKNKPKVLWGRKEAEYNRVRILILPLQAGIGGPELCLSSLTFNIKTATILNTVLLCVIYLTPCQTQYGYVSICYYC